MAASHITDHHKYQQDGNKEDGPGWNPLKDEHSVLFQLGCVPTGFS